MTTKIRRLLAAALFAAMPMLAEAQTISPLAGVTVTSPGSGQTTQNYSYLCSVSGCATGTVFHGTGLVQGNALLSVTNGLFSNMLQGNAALSATNGLYTNILQGNAAISATNGLYYNLLQGNAVISSSNPIFAQVTNTLTALVNNADSIAPISSVTATAGNSPVNNFNFIYNGTTYDRQRGSAVNTGVGLVNTPSPYPDGAVPITASATGTTAATTATLTNVSGHLTYICGYSIRANATAAATVTDTITGVKTATLSSILWVAPLASGIGVDDGVFTPCIPASAVSTSIAVVSGVPGAGGTVSVRAWGYSL